jgi:glycosyltransferase involved in cell wall biosynthesis
MKTLQPTKFSSSVPSGKRAPSGPTGEAVTRMPFGQPDEGPHPTDGEHPCAAAPASLRLRSAGPEMNVLQLCKFYPPVAGGMESVVHTLTEGLNRLGLRCDVLCAHVEPRTVRERAPLGFDIVRGASHGTLLSTSIAPALIGELRRLAPGRDVIHVHLPDPLTNLALWMTRPQARIVVHWHSDIVAQVRALKFYAPLQNWLLRRADAIVATSCAYARSSPWLVQHAAKVVVIPIGIPDPAGSAPGRAPSSRAQALRAEFGGRDIVFSLGRMTYYKGFGVLIEAARHLPESAVVVVGGGGELLQAHRDAVEQAGLQDRIRFVGRIADEALPAYYEAASLFCLPSVARSEAFGVVLLEAMAHGKPVIATDIAGSGVPWVNLHGVTGLNAPPRDAAALAAALCAALSDRAGLERYAAAARTRYLELFTADTMVESTALLYRQLLAAG